MKWARTLWTGMIGLGPVILVPLLLAVGGVWLFVEVADEVVEGESQHIDEWVVRAFRNPTNLADPIGPDWLEEAMRDFTGLGGTAVLTLAVIAVIGYLLLVRKFASAWLVLAATGSGVLVGSMLKYLFARPRPSVVPHLSHIMTTSFPSGHSMYSAIVYLTLGSLLIQFTSRWKAKVYIITAALVLIGLVGISRVYLGVHYPTDVLAGWTAGIVWALLCWTVARYLQQRGTVEPEPPRTGDPANS